MKFIHYLNDKLYLIFLFISTYFILFFMFLAFKIDSSIIITFTIIFLIFFILAITIGYFRKKNFYNTLLYNIENLDKPYLVLEMLDNPNFYEGKLLYQALYEINKSVAEIIKGYEYQITDFKDYIEMWIHEVKIPISSLVLIAHNHKDKFDKKSIEQMKRIEDYVEQVLYYVRSENAEKDYLINKIPLEKVISCVALKNKDDFLENKIELIVDNISYQVFTDSKWLEFILNQIINNSIKYRKSNNSYIKIKANEVKDKVILTIEDNGIGIPLSDIPRVFQKSFTGHNGRIKSKSTGMGLFIAKNLCNKLGHKIEIESKEGEYTKVIITLAKNKYYDVVK